MDASTFELERLSKGQESIELSAEISAMLKAEARCSRKSIAAIILETAVGRARVGCDGVRWQG